MVILIGQVDFGADQGDVELVIDETLSDAGIQDWSFVTWVCANQQKQVGVLNRSDARVHDVIAPQVGSRLKSSK